ncbi:MAG: hypothetical protein FJW20_02830 [Acidimicrobiia bacterium]|nr:hypothetical protein [Acidimicrobiia bacterium]
MLDLQAQLDDLRRRMADAVSRPSLFQPPPLPREEFLEQCIPGEVIESSLGTHYQTTRCWEHWRRHGCITISELNELPVNLLDGISQNELPSSPPESWAFLDTETTGLAGGSGTCAFLIGIGRITARGFEVRQFFMRDYQEEPAMLHSIEQQLAGVELLITYNGKSFDLPLLETRYRMSRRASPFSRIPHLDLLHGARRLWRLRFSSCKLTDLEAEVLGYLREGDVPGHLIPLLYFDFLRTRAAMRLVPVFLHNALDILTLACLTAVVPWAFRDATQLPIRHPAEMVSLGRWLRAAGQLEQALALFRRAADGLDRDDLLFRTLWDTALLEKKLGRPQQAITLFHDLALVPNPHRLSALEELAKHYEHRERNPSLALEFAEQAMQLGAGEPALRRRQRLAKKSGSLRSSAPGTLLPQQLLPR